MLSYCLKWRNNTENKKPKVVKTKNGKIMFLSKRVVYGSKKLKLFKEQEARELLSKLTRMIDIFEWFTHSKYFVLKV